MSLRARLTVSFAAVLAIPLIVSAVVVRVAVARQASGAERADLESAFRAASVLYGSATAQDAVTVERIARALAVRPDVAQTFSNADLASVAAARSRGSLDLLALVRPDGTVAGLSAVDPAFLPGAEPPPLSRIVSTRPNGWAALSEVRVGVACGRGCNRFVGSVVGGTWLDGTFLNTLALERTSITFEIDGRPVASTVLERSSETIDVRGAGPVLHGRLHGRAIVAARSALSPASPGLRVTVTARPQQRSGALALALTAMMVLALVAGTALAYFLARVHTHPIDELAAAARAVAHGDFERRIEPSEGELGELAGAFNLMTSSLKSHVGELESSRDQLLRWVRRFGEALQSTHDLTKLLSIVVETAMDAVQARSGAVYLVGATRQDLYVKVGRNLAVDARARIPMGEGVAGWVARERKPLLVPGAGPTRHEHEPAAETAISAPIESQGQVLGVLSLYGRRSSVPFGETDLVTIASLAQQAAVGIENVLLHQEAQRLSITDGLTGAWNYRYFQMRLAQEVERAIRFNRSFSMMILDIDHFKRVNDTYGHQRGDSILVEVARRIVGVIRAQVDTLARYGGEEFVLILPETSHDGAMVVAGKILESIGAEPFLSPGEEPVTITISIGLATFPEHGTTARTLIRAADLAMYEAKAQGRNRLVAASELDRAGVDEPRDSTGAPPVAEDSTRSQDRP